MGNDVDINVKAEIEEAKARIKTLTKTMGDMEKGGQSLKMSFTEVNSAFSLGKQGLQELKQVYEQTIGETMKYAATVRQMSRISGENAEETSRLIQLTDDLGVSQGDLETAMSASARKGIAFNTETIAKLADQYVALKDPVAKNTLLIDNFGRSGLNMAAAMEKGGESLRNMAKDVEANLILTDKQVQQSRNYEIALDNLNDKLQGYKVQIGTAVIPALVDYMNATNKNIDATERLKMSQPGYIAQLVSIEQTNRLAKEAAIGVTEQGFLQAQMLTGTLTPAIQGNKMTQDTLNTSMQTYNKQLLFQIASEGLSNEAKMKLALSMGLIDEKSRYAIVKTQEWKQTLDDGMMTVEEYNRKVASLANSWERLQSKSITLTIDTVETGTTGRRFGGSVDDFGYANGTSFIIPGGYHENFPIGPNGGASSGERVTVTPANQINNNMGGIVINIIGGDPQATANAVANKLKAQYGGAYQGM